MTRLREAIRRRHSGMRRQAQTSDVQLHIGESRDSGFDASHRPGMTGSGSLRSLVRADFHFGGHEPKRAEQLKRVLV